MTAGRSGIVLAGGRSSRMGTAKALLDFDGEPLLTRVARPLVARCEEVVLSVATEEHAPTSFVVDLTRALDRAGASRIIVARDRVAHCGPVGGLAAALKATTGKVAFAVGCDCPFLASSLVEGVLARAERPDRPDVVLPIHEGRPEPLLAAYRVATMGPHFAARLAAGGGRTTDAWDNLRVVHLEPSELRRLDPSGGSFLNVNDRDDYARARARLGSKV